MHIGMPRIDFWEGSPALVKDYRRKHDLDIESRNQELWMQGLYIMNAVSVSIANSFAKKGTPPKKYLEEPIRITPLTEAEKKEKAEKERKRAIAYFTKLEKQWNKRQEGAV